jgi:hypothetical protein
MTIGVGLTTLKLIINSFSTYGKSLGKVMDSVYEDYFGVNGNELLKSMYPDTM